MSLLLGSFAASAFAASRCEAPNNPIDRRACNIAKEGPQALRRFVARTQSLYMLYFNDYMSDADLERHYSTQRAQASLEPEARKVLAATAP